MVEIHIFCSPNLSKNLSVLLFALDFHSLSSLADQLVLMLGKRDTFRLIIHNYIPVCNYVDIHELIFSHIVRHFKITHLPRIHLTFATRCHIFIPIFQLINFTKRMSNENVKMPHTYPMC